MPNSAMDQLRNGGVSVGRLAALLDVSLEGIQRSLASLTEKGFVSGLKDGHPDEVIQLTEKGESLADRMQSEPTL